MSESRNYLINQFGARMQPVPTPIFTPSYTPILQYQNATLNQQQLIQQQMVSNSQPTMHIPCLQNSYLMNTIMSTAMRQASSFAGRPLIHHPANGQIIECIGRHHANTQLYSNRPVRDKQHSRQVMGRRQWETINNKSTINRNHLFFSVMSYNVLSEHLQQSNQTLYEASDPDDCRFEFRGKKLLAEIKSHNCSIVCLQEVDAIHFESHYMAHLSEHGYKGQFIKRSGLDKFDGVAILYKSDIFKLLHCEKVSYKVPGHAVLDRDNVGLILQLGLVNPRPNVPNKICVATTHLLFNERRGDVKLAQLAYLLAQLDKIAQIPGEEAGTYYPTIVTGDFNAVPASLLYKFMLTGELTYRGQDLVDISGQIQHERRRSVKTIQGNILPDFIAHNCTLKDPPPAQKPATNMNPRKKKRSDNSQYASSVSCLGTEERLLTHVHSTSCLTKPSQTTEQAPVGANHNVSDGQVECEEDEEPWGTITHKFNFISAYVHKRIQRLMPKYEPEVTIKHSFEGQNVDYIFFTVHSKQLTERGGVYGIRSKNLWQLRRYGLLADYELEEAGSLPNHWAPSDHLPIIAEFALQ